MFTETLFQRLASYYYIGIDQDYSPILVSGTIYLIIVILSSPGKRSYHWFIPQTVLQTYLRRQLHLKARCKLQTYRPL